MDWSRCTVLPSDTLFNLPLVLLWQLQQGQLAVLRPEKTLAKDRCPGCYFHFARMPLGPDLEVFWEKLVVYFLPKNRHYSLLLIKKKTNGRNSDVFNNLAR